MDASEIAKQLGHGWTFGASHVHYDSSDGYRVVVEWKEAYLLVVVRRKAGTINVPAPPSIFPWPKIHPREVEVVEYITKAVFESEGDAVVAIRKALKDHHDRVRRASEVLGEACGIAVKREDL